MFKERNKKWLTEKFVVTKYLLKFTLTGGTTISVVKEEKEFNEFMEWHNSATADEFIISNPSGFTSINRANLINFDYSIFTMPTRIAAPIFYIIFHPVPRGLTIFSYLIILLAEFVGAISILHFKSDLNVVNLSAVFSQSYEFTKGVFKSFYLVILFYCAIDALTDVRSLIKLDSFLSKNARLTRIFGLNSFFIFALFSEFKYEDFKALASLLLR